MSTTIPLPLQLIVRQYESFIDKKCTTRLVAFYVLHGLVYLERINSFSLLSDERNFRLTVHDSLRFPITRTKKFRKRSFVVRRAEGFCVSVNSSNESHFILRRRQNLWIKTPIGSMNGVRVLIKLRPST